MPRWWQRFVESQTVPIGTILLHSVAHSTRDGRPPVETKEKSMYANEHPDFGSKLQLQRDRQVSTGSGQKLAQALQTDLAAEQPLMARSLDEASKAVEQLAAQVEELMRKIAPVCQAQGGSVGDAEGKAPTEVASPVRAQVIKLRDRVEAIARRISSVRYTIEI